MDAVLPRVIETLAVIEQEKDVRVLYACESGSRVWGFHSPDSDYDIRFIYVCRPEWYLSIAEKQPDVIEKPITSGLDVSGWELRKALRLFRKSNPPLMEWLISPVVYLERGSIARRMRALMDRYYSPTACTYHYLHMARNNYREYLRGEEVWLKKYFYVLRPLLAVLWIEQGRGIVPTDFNVLVEHIEIPENVRDAIKRLLQEKKAGAELRRGPRVPAISEFIEAEFKRLQAKEIAYRAPETPIEPLEEVFLSGLKEAWGFDLT